DESIHVEQQRLAANQVSIGNLITSMRLLSALDWTLFFERVSLVEQILRQDPEGVYASMDFASRDMYRHEVERLAKRSRREETEVASAALDLARRTEVSTETTDRASHIGYYLVDGGRAELESQLHYRATARERTLRTLKRRPMLFYLGAVVMFCGLSLWGVT